MMNVVPLDPVLPEALRRQLAALPQFEPPARLRERVLGRGPQARRGLRAAPALAAALVAALGLGLIARDGPHDDAATRRAALEREFTALRTRAALPSAALALEAELSRVDRALQAAYDAGATPAEVDNLWGDRERLLDSLVLAYRQPDRVIRI